MYTVGRQWLIAQHFAGTAVAATADYGRGRKMRQGNRRVVACQWRDALSYAAEAVGCPLLSAWNQASEVNAATLETNDRKAGEVGQPSGPRA